MGHVRDLPKKSLGVDEKHDFKPTYEILALKPEEYWPLAGIREGSVPPPFETRLIKVDDKKAEPKSQAEIDAILARLKGASFVVRSVESKEKKKNPVPPFITSKLQQ